jgi:hypothetical protein
VGAWRGITDGNLGHVNRVACTMLPNSKDVEK